MSTPRFTLGPWTIQTVRTSCGVCFKVGPFPYKRDQLIHACVYADYPGTGPEYDELLANATLMAQAPTLFGIVRQYMASDERQGFTGTILYEQAKAAIDAAMGEKS